MRQLQTNRLTDNTDFIVKESKRVNLIFGVLLSVLAFIVLCNIVSDYHADQLPRYKKMLVLSLVPAAAFIVRWRLNTLLFRINKTGIYRCDVLLTDWDHFINARITQEAITGSYEDNFILIVEFFKENQPGTFIRKMKLPNTMEKSEEEIIEAIRYFSKFSGYTNSLSENK